MHLYRPDMQSYNNNKKRPTVTYYMTKESYYMTTKPCNELWQTAQRRPSTRATAQETHYKSDGLSVRRSVTEDLVLIQLKAA
jgi:hypothetical protein